MPDAAQPYELDHLTDAARAALKRGAGRAYESLVPDSSDANARAALDAVRTAGAVKQASNREADQCVQSGLWLWHDFLDESHTISQGIETPDGSFWHGIMHRREGDFSNSKYWYRRVGQHPAYATLAAEVRELTRDEPADKRVVALTHDGGGGGWDPYAFVDLCEAAHAAGPNDPLHAVAVAVQQAEWRVVFDHCVREARR